MSYAVDFEKLKAYYKIRYECLKELGLPKSKYIYILFLKIKGKSLIHHQFINAQILQNIYRISKEEEWLGT